MSSTPLHPNKNGVHKLKTHQGATFLFMVQLGVSTFCSFCNKHKATAWTPATNTLLKPPNWLLNHAVTISPVLEGRCNRRWWNRMIERAGKDVFHMTGHMNATVTENYPLSLWEGARVGSQGLQVNVHKGQFASKSVSLGLHLKCNWLGT
jgi:hypothetical protein